MTGINIFSCLTWLLGRLLLQRINSGLLLAIDTHSDGSRAPEFHHLVTWERAANWPWTHERTDVWYQPCRAISATEPGLEIINHHQRPSNHLSTPFVHDEGLPATSMNQLIVRGACLSTLFVNPYRRRRSYHSWLVSPQYLGDFAHPVASSTLVGCTKPWFHHRWSLVEPVGSTIQPDLLLLAV